MKMCLARRSPFALFGRALGVSLLAVLATACGADAGTLSPPENDAEMATTTSAATAATLESPRVLASKKGVLLGVAVDSSFLSDSNYSDIAKTNFNALVPENAMKMEKLQPSEGQWNFREADGLVSFANTNKMQVRGHTLLWHGQIPQWVRDKRYDQERAVLQSHIDTVVKHFGNTVYAWDVANETLKDDGTGFRNRTETGSNYSPWAANVNDDSLVKEAFYRADTVRKLKGYKTKLFLCDYSNHAKGKVKADKFYDVVRGWVASGVPIDGVAFQLHLSLRETFDPNPILENVQRFRALGLEVQFTEVDVRMDYADGVTDSELQAQANVYKGLMDMYVANQNTISTFVVWGVADHRSWLPTSWTTEGNPVLFDRNYRKKPALDAIQNALK
jgi:endo-1,4-beta-xylanase